MAQPHIRSPVVGGKPDWESQPGRGTWNRTVIPRRMDRSAKEIAGWILAKVNGMGPQASLQQEASPGQHAHQRGDSSRRFRSYFLATNMRASIKCHCSANICWCATLHACLTFFYDASPTWKGFRCFCHGRDLNGHSRLRPALHWNALSGPNIDGRELAGDQKLIKPRLLH